MVFVDCHSQQCFSSDISDLRLTLDRDVTLIDETSRTRTLGKPSWCLSDSEAKSSAKAVKVPFNVFEVKLVGENPMPLGLAALISGGVIEEAPKFSKFLSGAAAFNRVPTLPYWASHPAFASMFDLKAKESVDDPQGFTSLCDPCDCYQLFGADDAMFGSSSGVKKRNPILTAIYGFPKATTGSAEVVFIGSAGTTGATQGTAATVGANIAPFHFFVKFRSKPGRRFLCL